MGAGSALSGRLGPPYRVAVAFSGGRDSVALLHATAKALQSLGLGAEVVALHVHHGLSVHADDWLVHAQRMCATLKTQGLPVSLRWRHLTLAPQAGDSVEALARRARYQALAEMAREAGADLVLLGQHRRDQAETFLLQALRGGGVRGLSAMPADTVRDGIRWVRPWLSRTREEVEAYVEHHGLHYVDDDSNEDPRYARNRLRREVWPALIAAFPGAEACLAASARRLQDVLPLVQAREQAWLQALVTVDDAGQATLDVARWSELSGGDRRLALVAWYRSVSGSGLPANWVERLAAELPGLVYRGRACRWGALNLALYRGRLSWLPAAHAGGEAGRASDVRRLQVCRPGAYPLPGWGTLRVFEVPAGGVAPHVLGDIELRPRRGGEQFQAGPGRPPRCLKKQYQSAGVPPWCRGGPLLWSGGQLVFVPHLGIDARCLAAADGPQWGMEWLAEQP